MYCTHGARSNAIVEVAAKGGGGGGNWNLKTEHRIKSATPVAYQVVILVPGIGQFREFESPRVHTRINSWGIFLEHKLT